MIPKIVIKENDKIKILKSENYNYFFENEFQGVSQSL